LAELERRLAEVERLARTRGRHVEPEVVGLLPAAHRAFGSRRWTVGYLAQVGLVERDEGQRIGRALAASDGAVVDGLRLEPAGLVGAARAWRVMQDACIAP
jgi:hypothetical protein